MLANEHGVASTPKGQLISECLFDILNFPKTDAILSRNSPKAIWFKKRQKKSKPRNGFGE